jgi:hypothetical protein
MACKNPARFGALSQQFAQKASAWANQVGQLASRAIANAKRSGGAVKGFILNKLAAVVAKLKSLPGLLSSAAAAGKQQVQQLSKQVQHHAREGALRGGAALHNAGQAVQHGTNKASNAVFKAGLGVENRAGGVGRAIQRGSGLVQRAGQAPARALKQAGTGIIKRAIPA